MKTKFMKTALSAMLLAGAVMTSNMASAADASHSTTAISFLDGTRDYGASFADGLKAYTFADEYTFTVTGTNELTSLVSSISSKVSNGLTITGFNLAGAGSSYAGTLLSSGKIDLWSLEVDTLAAGTYTLTVLGKIDSNVSASYSGNINVSAVPEPETYAMMLAGLGLVGFMARRRKSVTKAA